MNGLHQNMFVNGKDIMGVIDTMGGRLMLARKDAGLNQLELLERLKEKGHDITPAHWSRVEGNKRGISLELLTADVDAALQTEQMTGRRLDRLEEIVSSGATMLTLTAIPTANAYFRRLIRVWVKDNEVASVDVI